MGVIRRNILFILSACFFIIIGCLYIERAYIDVPIVDGLLMLPNVEKYFLKTFSLIDFNQVWGEHRLIGYAVIYLINTLFFGLNIKLEAYIFVIAYTFICIMLYRSFIRSIPHSPRKKQGLLIQLFFLPILFTIFSLAHPLFYT